MKKLSFYTTLKAAALLFTAAIVTTSCVRVVDGPAGPQGPAGQNGNANVISINYEVFDNNWYDVGTPGADDYFLALDLDVPEITADIVNSGLVLVYYRPDNQSPWFALPYTVISHSPSYMEKLDFIYDVAFVGMQSKASDRNASAWNGTFRIVIASGVPVGKTALDYSDYNETAAMLGIDETQQIYR